MAIFSLITTNLKRLLFSKNKYILINILLTLISGNVLLNNIKYAKGSEDSDNLKLVQKPPVIIESKLSYCGNVDENSRTINRRLLYVTTLDGKLTALNLSDKGKLYWEIKTGPGPLISSSIHRLELTNNGQLVRMIPSLNGAIYKFDGESIDPIPITAENLLSSSFKFSDDLVISGGKETRTYGVSARTGQLLYECTMNGCLNNTEPNYNKDSSVLDDGILEHDSLLDDIVVVRRQTQTVRAVEPRIGSERWNFSVGQHEIEVLKSQGCHDRPLNTEDLKVFDLDIQIVVPEGLIIAFSKSNPDTLLWKYKFEHPIVSAWRTDLNDMLQSVDLFNSTQWVWNVGLSAPPAIYLGMYNKQLYIQESIQLRNLLFDKSNEFGNFMIADDNDSNLPSIPWKPLIVSSSLLALQNKNLLELEGPEAENIAVTALSVLYASEYVNGNGFFLFTNDQINNKTSELCSKNATVTNESSPLDEFDFDFTGEPVNLLMGSLWFWWKEVIVISLTTAVILNILFSVKLRPEILVIERHIPVPTAIEATEESVSRSTLRTFSESNGSNASDNFSSRFQSDFDLMQCLGKGGFGVVFEARNKLDDCNYAVKRIQLPNKKERRERVMREVKTLANCEHQNIVRYFQAWVESPPPGWQEEEDSKWMEKDMSSATSIQIETPDGSTLPSVAKYRNKSELTNAFNHVNSIKSWVSDVHKDASTLFGKYNKFVNHDASDSFIQFKSDTQDDNNNSEDSSDSKEHSNQVNSMSRNDSTNSFQIEFEHSKNTANNKTVLPYADNKCFGDDSVISNGTTNTYSKRINGHKRPLSLDLSKPIQNKVYLYIQMQLCRKESLKDWLKDNQLCSRQPHIQNIFQQIVHAVDYVHQKGLIHRDLKPSNIFFSLDGNIRIGDFGLVTDMPDPLECNDMNPQINNRHTQQVGTCLYMSPEQLQGKTYDFKVDIYSLGLILFELLVYFGTEMERIYTLKSLRNEIFPQNFQDKFPEEHNLLKLMLSMQAIQRPSTNEIQTKLCAMSSWIQISDNGDKLRRLSETVV